MYVYIYTVCIHKYMYTFTSITYVQDTMTGELSTKRKNTSPAPPLVFGAQVSPIQSSTCPTFTQPKCSSATYSLSLNNTGNENRGEDEGRQRPTACTVLVAATRKQLPGREEKKKSRQHRRWGFGQVVVEARSCRPSVSHKTLCAIICKWPKDNEVVSRAPLVSWVLVVFHFFSQFCAEQRDFTLQVFFVCLPRTG